MEFTVQKYWTLKIKMTIGWLLVLSVGIKDNLTIYLNMQNVKPMWLILYIIFHKFYK